MKNVTGLDLVKFLAGSYGTLAVMSEVTLKVLPAPETEATLVLKGLDDGRAVAALSAALGSPFSVTGAAHSPATRNRGGQTWMRVEGFTDSVRHRLAGLADTLSAFGTADRLEGDASVECWKAIRELKMIAEPRGAAVWRVSVRPSDGPRVAAAAAAELDCRILYDWGGGLLWIACADAPDAGAGAIRPSLERLGGHATLVRAPEPVRQAVAVFEPPSKPVMAVSRRLKEAFDPAGVLNPGRLYAGV